MLKGLVIAGGKSTRMGTDKAFLQYGGAVQYIVVCELLKEFCDSVFVGVSSYNAHIQQAQITDKSDFENAGPMASILSAHIAEPETNWLVCAIDYPYLSAVEIMQLVTYYKKTGLSCAMYNTDTGFYEPFIGIYTAAFIVDVLKAYKNGENSMQKILMKNKVQKVQVLDNQKILSTNTKEQLQQIANKIKQTEWKQ